MKNLKLSLITGALLTSSAAFAEVTAIVDTTVYTSTAQGKLENATVLIEDGKIIAINPESVQADITVDGKNHILTPGMIGSLNQLGLIEVGNVTSTNDFRDPKAGITFDPSSAFNPRSSLIPFARKGGLTQNISIPHGGKTIFKGLAFTAELSGEFNSVSDSETALVVHLGASSSGSRAAKLTSLIEKLEGHQEKLAAAKKDDKKKDKKPSAEAKILTQVLNAEIPLVVSANRATDLLAVLEIKARFGLNVIIAGGADALLVKAQLAESNTPVVLNALSNLPSGFDYMHTSLEVAGKLEAAGVPVIFSVFGDGSYNTYQLRYHAGIAVANGMSYEGAIKAITANTADAFGIEGGKIAVGAKADLVLWSADPLDFSAHVEKMWINGEEVSTESRHDKLRDRYMGTSEMPRAYTK